MSYGGHVLWGTSSCNVLWGTHFCLSCGSIRCSFESEGWEDKVDGTIRIKLQESEARGKVGEDPKQEEKVGENPKCYERSSECEATTTRQEAKRVE